jgi:hypothetical protein
MSLLRGQFGDLPRQDYVQPSSGPFLSKGNFLDPERPSSLGIEDRSRYRPQSFVAPRDIELMQGAFTIPGYSNYTGQPPK